jgi:hypothetical protein
VAFGRNGILAADSTNFTKSKLVLKSVESVAEAFALCLWKILPEKQDTFLLFEETPGEYKQLWSLETISAKINDHAVTARESDANVLETRSTPKGSERSQAHAISGP